LLAATRTCLEVQEAADRDMTGILLSS